MAPHLKITWAFRWSFHQHNSPFACTLAFWFFHLLWREFSHLQSISGRKKSQSALPHRKAPHRSSHIFCSHRSYLSDCFVLILLFSRSANVLCVLSSDISLLKKCFSGTTTSAKWRQMQPNSFSELSLDYGSFSLLSCPPCDKCLDHFQFPFYVLSLGSIKVITKHLSWI